MSWLVKCMLHILSMNLNIRSIWKRLKSSTPGRIWRALRFLSLVLSVVSIIVPWYGVELSPPNRDVLLGYRWFIDRLFYFSINIWSPIRISAGFQDYLVVHAMSAFIETKIRLSEKPWISGNEAVAFLFKLRAWALGPACIAFWVMEGLMIPLARATFLSFRHATQSDLSRYRGRLIAPKLLQQREDIIAKIKQGRGHWIAQNRVDKIDALLIKARKRDRRVKTKEISNVLCSHFVSFYYSISIPTAIIAFFAWNQLTRFIMNNVGL